MTTLTPVAPRERLATLDVLRGFALCGVLIANVFWLYSARQFENPDNSRRIDLIATIWAALMVHGKAQTLLTFLFGFGFAAQLLRAQARHEPVLGLYLRRMVVLFCVGALHVTFLWWGDVTWHYALTGLLLLPFLRVSNRTRLIAAAIFTFVPELIVWGVPSVRAHFIDRTKFAAAVQAFLAVLHGPRYLPTLAMHVHFALVYVAPACLTYPLWLLARFLVGFVAGTQGWFDDDGARHLRLFRRMLGFGLLCTLGELAPAIAPPGPGRLSLGVVASLAITALEQIGTLGLTAVYLASVVLLMQRPRWRRLISVVAPVGRMPLTTYLSQSVICTFLFYGWGLGWSGHVGAAGCVALALAIFTLQLLACRLWLRRFRFGPLEWLWRTLVYLQRQPMRI